MNHHATSLFKKNYDTKAQVIINQGGTSSGKTYAILQILFFIACQTAKQIITIVGQDIPNLKAGALRDALSIYQSSPQLQAIVKSYNITDIFLFSAAQKNVNYFSHLINQFDNDSYRA